VTLSLHTRTPETHLQHTLRTAIRHSGFQAHKSNFLQNSPPAAARRTLSLQYPGTPPCKISAQGLVCAHAFLGLCTCIFWFLHMHILVCAHAYTPGTPPCKVSAHGLVCAHAYFGFCTCISWSVHMHLHLALRPARSVHMAWSVHMHILVCAHAFLGLCTCIYWSVHMHILVCAHTYTPGTPPCKVSAHGLVRAGESLWS